MTHHAATWITFVAVVWAVLAAAAGAAWRRREQAKPPTPVKPADRTTKKDNRNA